MSVPGLSAVSNTSPKNIELAPAKKHKACVELDISDLPAESLTVDIGIIILAKAIVLTNSIWSNGSTFPNGVPGILINIFIGTLSGCSSKLDNVLSISALSVRDSPIPIIPPEHTFTPALLTF